jgi:type I restriction enzyme S subunit
LSAWPSVTVADVCELIVDCVNRTAPLSSEPTPFKMIRTTNVRQGFIDTENVRYVDEATFRKWTRRGAPRPGDVVLTREAPLGEVGIVRTAEPVFLGQRTIMYRADSNKVEPYFLMYSMLSAPVQGQIRGYGSGATVEHMRLSDCFNLTLPLPPLTVQRKIAAILSRYDDVMENNNRRIRILDEMARRIYREWFVDFRYPGHEDVPMVMSELGPIPEAWPVMPLSALTSTQYGYTESATTDPVGPRFLRGMDINKTSYVDWAAVPYCAIDDDDRDKYRLARDDVVIIRMADPGKVGIVEADVDAVFASYLIRIQPDPSSLTPYFLFYFLSSDSYQDFVSGASTGTTRKSLSAPLIVSARLALPPAATQAAFVGAVAPLRQLINVLVRANDTLRETRALLLPRLISGEIDVTHLDIAVPEPAA